jgi:uncharacterized delta-60 repeat protein/uncharacterized repeat protein (TIGR01451 family)
MLTTTTTSNAFCLPPVTATNLVPSATPDIDYVPSSGTITLIDFQMATNIAYDVLPGTGLVMIGTNIDYTSLRNHLVLITLGQPALDPLEDTNDVAQPTLAAQTAYSELQNLYVIGATPCQTTNSIINMLYSVATIPEGSPNLIWLLSLSAINTGTNLTGASVTYTQDAKPLNRLDTFPLQPGSDYATPGGPPTNAPASRENPHFQLVGGTISFPTGGGISTIVGAIQSIYDPAVQFNEDLDVLFTPPQPANPTGAVFGQITSFYVTVLFNDQPAGAVDRLHNPDNDASTIPPLNASPGAGGPQNIVYAAAVQPNNQTVFGGDFVAYNTVPQNRIARMNADGSLDTTFLAAPNSGANNTVTCLALQPDGKIVIGGVFTSFNATNRFGIARLNSDGSLDTTFNPGFGVNGTVTCLALYPQSDPINPGKVVIGGNFTTVNSTNMNFIARLNTNGSLDTTFNPGAGPNAPVNAIALQDDGNIVVGGQFTSIDGTHFSHIARLTSTGSLDTTFNPGLGADQPVYALAEEAGGSVLVGGDFSNINLTSRNHIARLLSNGTIDATFDPGSGTDDDVLAIALQPDGNILIGGPFTSINGTRRVGVARLLSSGFVDTTFMDTAYNQFAGLINPLHNQAIQPKNFLKTISVQADGGVIIGGRFSQLGGGYTREEIHIRQNIARLIGGSTPGPGNIGLAYNTYSVDKANEEFFVSMVRTNGFLGPAGVTLQPIPQHVGPGNAVPGVDFAQTVLTPTWPTTWGDTWMFSDDFLGPNFKPTDFLGRNYYVFTTTGQTNAYTLPGAQFEIFDNTNSSGNLALDLQLTQPLGSLFLGGEPIPTGVALGTAAAPLTIVDDSVPAGTLGFVMPTNYFVSENATNAVITVIRTNGSVGQVTIQYATVPGTGPQGALPGNTNDYISETGTLIFPSGQTNASFLVPIVNNFVVRPDRTLGLILYNATGGAIVGANSNATLTIINDNFLPGMLSFSSTNYVTNQNAGAATISVVRLGGSQGTETIAFATSNGSATNGTDYVGTNGILTWNSGDTAPKTFTIPILNSGLVNSNTTVILTLSNATVNGFLNTNAIQPPTNAVLTIINQNHYGSPTLSAPAYFVNENAGYVVITVNRLGGDSQAITVDYATSDGTALAFTDYIPVSGTLTFTNGQFSESFAVPIINNNPQTNNFFSFNVNLRNPTPSSGPVGGVALGNPSTAPVTIIANQVNDEPPGGLDTTFDPDAAFNATVYALALQTNGSIIAGGDFTSANNIALNRIARLNADGTLDIKFSSSVDGANNSVRAITVQTDGQILVSGLFTTFNGVNQNYFARLNYDGSLDSTFNTGSGADNPVYGIAETFGNTYVAGSNRKILLGGSFASIGGIPYRSIAQLNEDGSVDTTFKASGANATIYAVAVYSTNDAVNSGKILVAGDFTQINGSNVNYIARLNADGSLDSGFNNLNLGSGPNGSVRTVAIQVDGGVVIGGLFTSVDGSPVNYVGRLTPAGHLDPNFNIGDGANNAVTSLALEQDLAIVVGGSFTEASDVTRNRLTRLNHDGTVDTGINFGTGANNLVASVVIQPDGKLVIGGSFTTFEGQPKPYIARIFGGSTTDSGTVSFTSYSYQVNEALTNAVISVYRSGGTTNSITVTASTSDGTALAGVDYAAVSTNLTFPQGETFESFSVPILIDPTNLGQLSLNLTLSDPNPANALGGQSTAVLNIIGANSTVSFASANYAVNKNTGTGMAIITINRNQSSIGTASIDFETTLTGTATPGTDYTAVSNTVFFANGQTNATVTVPIINNGLPEGNLTVGLALLNPTNTALDAVLPTTATLTIVDNSLAVGNFAFSASSYSVPETSSNAVITVIRTNGSVGQVSVNYSVGGGTAVAGVDYVVTSGAVSFLDGQTSQTFLVPVLDDPNLTSDVTVNLTLSAPTGGAGINPPVTVPLTIQNANLDVSFAQAGYFVDEKSGSIIIGVNRFGTTNGTVVVQYATEDGTATTGTNYLATSGTLTFAPGQTFQTFLIPILYDPQITGDLSFFVNLTKTNGSPVQLVAPATTTVTVLDDDSGFSLSTNTYSATKTNSSETISVLRFGNTSGQSTVNYNVSGGTALPNVQYVPTSGVLTFLSGQASNSFNIAILDDNQIDGNLTVDIALSAPSAPAQLLSPSNAVLTIIDTESGVSLSSQNYSVDENGATAVITAVRTGVTNTSCTVNYATSDGTAHAGSQYTATSGTLTFTNGQTSATFTVPIIDNNVTGGSETVLLQLSAPSAGCTLVSPTAATLTILNDDGALIVPAGAALLSPAGGTINPGATVTVLLSLLNTAGSTATNVVATLQATNNVIPSGTQSQNYGNLIVNGPSVFRPFTFSTSATNTNGTAIGVVLNLQFDTTNTAKATFSFALGTSTNYFTNNSVIIINDISAATPYPSVINVSSVVGLVSNVSVTLSNLGHGYVSDVSALVVGPAGQKDLLMEKTGGGHTITNVTLTFDSRSTASLTTNAPTTGTYQPSPLVTGIPFPEGTNVVGGVTNVVTPPPAPYSTSLTNLIGSNPNGAWSLYVDDTQVLDTGEITGGWLLGITTINVLTPNVDLVLGMSASPTSVVVSNTLTYTLAVTNAGPSPATGVVITNTLPPGVTNVTTASSQGTSVTNGGSIITTLGNLATNGTATVTITVLPTVSAIGLITNTATVAANEVEDNVLDNTAAVTNDVLQASADLAIGVSDFPNPIFAGGYLTNIIVVTNLGPAAAIDVLVTNNLPDGVAFVSQNAPGGVTTNGSMLTFSLGNLLSGATLTFTNVVQPGVAGIITNSFTVGSTVYDPLKGNNTAAVKTVVLPVSAIPLSLVAAGNSLSFSWPVTGSVTFSLQVATTLSPPNWTTLTNQPSVVGGVDTLTMPVGAGTQFFRLIGN